MTFIEVSALRYTEVEEAFLITAEQISLKIKEHGKAKSMGVKLSPILSETSQKEQKISKKMSDCCK